MRATLHGLVTVQSHVDHRMLTAARIGTKGRKHRRGGIVHKTIVFCDTAHTRSARAVEILMA
jgi:hypothetical protein